MAGFWLPSGSSSGAGSGSDPTIDDSASFDAALGADLGYDVEFNGNGTTLPTGWSWFNQGTASFRERFGVGSLVIPNSGAHYRIIDRPIPSESTWTLYARMTSTVNNADSNGYGLTLRESSTGKVITWHQDMGSNLRIVSWSAVDPTSGAGVPFGIGEDNKRYRGFAIRRNSATSYDFGWFMDSEVRWLSTALNPGWTVDRIGFGGQADGVSTDAHISCRWFRVR